MSTYSDMWIDEQGHGAVRLVTRARETPPASGETPRRYQHVTTVASSELHSYRLGREGFREYIETTALHELALFCVREHTWVEKPTLSWERYDATKGAWNPYVWPATEPEGGDG